MNSIISDVRKRWKSNLYYGLKKKVNASLMSISNVHIATWRYQIRIHIKLI